MFHVSTCLLSKTVRRRHVVVVRRRDDVLRRRPDDDVRRRRRTYITGFSVTFLCKYLSVFLTRCFYTVNEFIYAVSRIYLLTYLLTRTSSSRRRRTMSR